MTAGEMVKVLAGRDQDAEVLFCSGGPAGQAFLPVEKVETWPLAELRAAAPVKLPLGYKRPKVVVLWAADLGNDPRLEG